MSRQAKRVHKNFEWPMSETWWGYLLDPIPCRTCQGSGKNSQGEYCTTCDGEGDVVARVEPDAYDVGSEPSWFSVCEDKYGWQMWEDTSEGSPMSPILDSPDELARWLEENKASAFGGMTASYESWLATIDHGSAPSMIMTLREDGTGTIESGVEHLGNRPD